jgi:putative ubiquitin-RnfH superfamily antitoxin RatB of RatAB toxin-antitoxin module
MVEVIHVDAESRVERRRTRLPAGSTVMQAIVASGIVSVLPPGTLDPARLGIFGRKVTPEQLVRDGDRVEICRPLAFDPKEARRRRVR